MEGDKRVESKKRRRYGRRLTGDCDLDPSILRLRICEFVRRAGSAIGRWDLANRMTSHDYPDYWQHFDWLVETGILSTAKVGRKTVVNLVRWPRELEPAPPKPRRHRPGRGQSEWFRRNIAAGTPRGSRPAAGPRTSGIREPAGTRSVGSHLDRVHSKEKNRAEIRTGIPEPRLLDDDVGRKHGRPCDMLDWATRRPCPSDFCWVLCGHYVCGCCMGRNNLEQWKARFRRGEFKELIAKGPHYAGAPKPKPADPALAKMLDDSRMAVAWQTLPDSKALELEARLKKHGLRTRRNGGRVEVMYGGWDNWVPVEQYPMHTLPE